MKNNNVETMTRKDFLALPMRKTVCAENDERFSEIVILPTRRKHDSGYRCMDFVAVRNGKAVCRLSGCSDVLHLNGIGGYGWKWLERYPGVPVAVPPVGWQIDCLPASGLLRIWQRDTLELIATEPLSSFEIYAVGKRR